MSRNYIGVGLALGAGVGTALGTAMNSLATGLSLGIALGLLWGMAMTRRSQKNEAARRANEADIPISSSRSADDGDES